ncbi:MAG: alpha/beta hydrolase [Bacteroidota bacterium]|nr:alpha/beta hydrolase [Bacteroidota bacterium]
MHYIEKGRGEKTFLFLHYFGGAASTWNEVIDCLQNEFRCIAVDLLGFGKSPLPGKTISVDDSANAVVELIGELHLSNFILIGHSMGGKIALAIAALQPEGLLGLVLIAPSPPSPEPMTDEERKEMNDAFGNKTKVEKLLHSAMAKPLQATVFEREVNNNLSVSEVAWHSWPEMGSKENITDKMKLVKVAVSIICGEKDKRFTKQFVRKEFDKYFINFSLAEIKNSGHLLPVEAAKEVAKEIRKSV